VRRSALPLALLAAVAGCGGDDRAPEPRSFELPPFELSPVVATALAELESVLAPGEPPAEAESEHVRGLTSMVAGTDAGMRAVALEEAAGNGDAFVPELVRLASSAGLRDGERQAAIELLGRLDTWRAAEALAVMLETAAEPWVRAHAAWRLGTTTQDWIVPRLLLRLKYETDHDTVIWLTHTLARFGNYQGLLALNVVATQSSDDNLRASALARMGEVVAGSGFDSVQSLWEAWSNEARDAVFRPERSLRFDLQIWRRIERLREFQLRGVDDSRYVFQGLGPHTAGLLARALHDENVYVRVHCTQGLARMGPRGTPGGPALVEALGEPELGPHAAAALRAIRYLPAVQVLVGCLDPDAPPDLRLASARALGGFGPETAETSAPALFALLLENESPELHQAAAESLAYLGHGDEVASRLASFLTSTNVEPVTSEQALRHWLALRAEADEQAATALAEWDALLIPNDRIVPADEKRASRSARRTLVEALLE